MTQPPASEVDAETELTVKCQVSSSNPASSVVWRKGGVIVTGSDSSEAGANSGTVGTSEYRFTPQKAFNRVTVTCTPRWEGTELSGQTKTVTLNVICK